ncbi:MAG: hypothetical protein WA783_01040 [Phormidesmis sp.]
MANPSNNVQANDTRANSAQADNIQANNIQANNIQVNSFSVSAQKILQIVPRIAPDMDGVGEYAVRLAQRLKANYQIDSAFLVIRPSSKTQSVLDGFDVHSLHTHSVEAFLSAIPPDVSTVVLQYSNYPYLQGKLDAPMWLGAAMKALKKKGILTVVMFHELPTIKYGAVHVSNPIQSRLSRSLSKNTDIIITNNEAFHAALANWTPKPVRLVPNFATIKEPDTVLPLKERDRAIIVFGSTDRRRVYQNNLPRLKDICEQLNIHTLYDVGRLIDWPTKDLGPNVQVEKTGILPDEDVSALMSRCMAGIFDYHRFPRNLSKSSVYAAYCAHGLVPICNGRSLQPQDGIIANQQYVDTFTLHARSQQSSSDDWLQTIASNAHALYLTRSLDRCAEKYAALIRPGSAPHLTQNALA